VHAGVIWLLFEGFHLPGAVWFALAEFILHWLIDFAKCERWTNFHQDQSLHLVCKLGYLGVLLMYC
jgi:hypothetical protein